MKTIVTIVLLGIIGLNAQPVSAQSEFLETPQTVERKKMEPVYVSKSDRHYALGKYLTRKRRASQAADFVAAGSRALYDFALDRRLEKELAGKINQGLVSTERQGYRGMLLQAEAYLEVQHTGDPVLRFSQDAYRVLGGGETPEATLAESWSSDRFRPGPHTEWRRAKERDRFVWIQSSKDGRYLEVHDIRTADLRRAARILDTEQSLFEATRKADNLKRVGRKLELVKALARQRDQREIINDISTRRNEAMRTLEEINGELDRAVEKARRSNKIAEKFELMSSILGIAAAAYEIGQDLGQDTPESIEVLSMSSDGGPEIDKLYKDAFEDLVGITDANNQRVDQISSRLGSLESKIRQNERVLDKALDNPTNSDLVPLKTGPSFT